MKAGRIQVRGIGLSHPERVVFPAQGYTKLQLARYHDAVAERELPHLRGRPLTLVRCGGAIGEGCSFMRHSKVWAPAALRRVRIQEQKKLGEYLVADTPEAVIALAQMDVVEIHTWNTRDLDVERPDRIVVDLDPGPEVRFREVVAAARLLRGALEVLGLRSFVKTTGGLGLHVVAPLLPERDWSECLSFSRGLAQLVAREHPRGVHRPVCSGRAGEEDPRRLPAQQPHQYLDCRLLAAGARRSAGVHAFGVGGAVAAARPCQVHHRDGAGAAARRSLARIVEAAPADHGGGAARRFRGATLERAPASSVPRAPARARRDRRR